MKKTVQNKLVMFKTVKQIVEANGTNWEGIPAFVRTFENFSLKLSELETKSNKHGVIAMGVKNNKDNLRRETINAALPLIGVLKSLSVKLNNEALKARMDINTSKLNSASRVVLIQLIDRVLESAEEHLSSLEEYGITIDSVVALSEKRNSLYSKLLSPREAILERKSITKSIDELVNEMNELLKNDLDQFMKVIKSANQGFYDSYFSARKTIETKSRDAGAGENLSN